MGKATRWWKSLLGMKKEKDQSENSTSVSTDKKEKRRWSFAKSGRDSVQKPVADRPRTLATSDPAWLRSYVVDSEKEQKKHAIAVAAATAAAADAAVAAAEAAVAVVRLTSQGNRALFGGGRETRAAIKIQTVFRGYLARKALRALRGLVKIQALVRGYLVRKQAAATLHSMQALIRAQTAVRTQRARRSCNKENRVLAEFRHRKSLECLNESRSEFHSKRMSYESCYNCFDESPKIVEIDTTYKPRSRSRRFTTALSECGEDMPYQVIKSPLPCPVPNRISMADCRHIHGMEWCFVGDEYRISTAQNTPRFAHSIWPNAPATPSKSVCGDSFFRQHSDCPNYMANTQSFKAKLRSLSAPKQRPETLSKNRLSLSEIMAARNSISGVRMQRSFNQPQEEGIEF